MASAISFKKGLGKCVVHAIKIPPRVRGRARALEILPEQLALDKGVAPLKGVLRVLKKPVGAHHRHGPPLVITNACLSEPNSLTVATYVRNAGAKYPPASLVRR